ncbi:hypothetical protein PRIPAC_81598 [Pristionchus pacificus]|uniref:Uncharacterized protein n=1 Tax=Pristionchus pacificus TaxID=54126 RepID=A0A2A6CB84_PRIPA|nr:hypothetical protein PRIPAC_81598 [Pristionchus pacificus]|eukprot:PDM75366.1 hypothetical protein PRIPAC_42543 [Pristionchus pacificus]
MQFALTGLENLVMQIKMKGLIHDKLNALERAIRDRVDIGIVLILHNKDDDIVDVRSFQISELTHDRTFGIHEIWQMHPNEYNLVKIPDAEMEFRREDENTLRV